MSAPRGDRTSALSPARLARIHAYMALHLAERLSLETLAALVGYHPLYFQRVYRRATGRTPRRALLALRMAYAAERLRTTPLRCGDIALEVGLDASRFSWHFQRTYGCPPTVYRQRVADARPHHPESRRFP